MIYVLVGVVMFVVLLVGLRRRRRSAAAEPGVVVGHAHWRGPRRLNGRPAVRVPPRGKASRGPKR